MIKPDSIIGAITTYDGNEPFFMMGERARILRIVCDYDPRYNVWCDAPCRGLCTDAEIAELGGVSVMDYAQVEFINQRGKEQGMRQLVPILDLEMFAYLRNAPHLGRAIMQPSLRDPLSTESERAHPWRRVTEVGAHATLGTVLRLVCGHSLYGLLPAERVRCMKCKPRSACSCQACRA
jgi:hypothetical protein